MSAAALATNPASAPSVPGASPASRPVAAVHAEDAAPSWNAQAFSAVALAACPDAVLVFVAVEDADEPILAWANETWCDWTGADAPSGRPPAAQGDSGSQPETWWQVVSALQHGHAVRHDVQFRRIDGSLRVLDVDLAPAIPDRVPPSLRGRGMVWVASLRDCTERRTQDAKAAHLHKMDAIVRLAGGVAHEFNNLLTIISGFGELALQASLPQSPIHDDLVEVQRAADRAATVTAQWLAFSRKTVLQPRSLDLSSAVADLESTLAQLVGRDVDLVTRLDAQRGMVQMDPRQFEQLLVTLAAHARHEMGGGGQLTIETRDVDFAPGPSDAPSSCSPHVPGDALSGPRLAPGPCVELLVRDTGLGLEGEALARLFEPFYSPRNCGVGTGMGLASAYGIVKQSGGHIEVTSTIGRGTAFRILFPRQEGVQGRWGGSLEP